MSPPLKTPENGAGAPFYTNHTEAITAAQSALVVSGVIGADPLVIWRG